MIAVYDANWRPLGWTWLLSSPTMQVRAPGAPPPSCAGCSAFDTVEAGVADGFNPPLLKQVWDARLLNDGNGHIFVNFNCKSCVLAINHLFVTGDATSDGGVTNLRSWSRRIATDHAAAGTRQKSGGVCGRRRRAHAATVARARRPQRHAAVHAAPDVARAAARWSSAAARRTAARSRSTRSSAASTSCASYTTTRWATSASPTAAACRRRPTWCRSAAPTAARPRSASATSTATTARGSASSCGASNAAARRGRGRPTPTARGGGGGGGARGALRVRQPVQPLLVRARRAGAAPDRRHEWRVVPRRGARPARLRVGAIRVRDRRRRRRRRPRRLLRRERLRGEGGERPAPQRVGGAGAARRRGRYVRREIGIDRAYTKLDRRPMRVVGRRGS